MLLNYSTVTELLNPHQDPVALPLEKDVQQVQICLLEEQTNLIPQLMSSFKAGCWWLSPSPFSFLVAANCYGFCATISPETKIPSMYFFKGRLGQNASRFNLSFIFCITCIIYVNMRIFCCTHCSKSSFFVQKFNFDFPRKLSNFGGEKLVKMLWFWTF